MSNRNMMNEAIDDIIEIVQGQAKTDPVYDELDYRIEGGRRYSTKEIEDMANNVCVLYTYFYDEVYPNDAPEACYDRALDVVIKSTAAAFALKSTAVTNKLTDNEYYDLEDDVKDWKDLMRDYTAWSRGSSRRGGRDDRYQSRPTRQAAQAPRRAPSGGRSIFADERDTGGVKGGGTGQTRTRASVLAEKRREQRQAQQPARTTRARTAVAEPVVPKFEYITEVADLAQHKLRPGQTEVPHYDPLTQRVQAFVDKDGFVTFNILEVNEMNPEMHKTVLNTMLSPSRRDEYVNGTSKRIVYTANGMELDPAQVESRMTQSVLKEWEEAGLIKAGTKFNNLDEPKKLELLKESTKRLNEDRELKASARKAKLIENGDFEKYQKTTTMVKDSTVYDITSIQELVSTKIISRMGSTGSTDNTRAEGYILHYRKIDTLFRCESPAARQILSNLLVGFADGTVSSIMKLKQSLMSKEVPVSLFTILNNECTVAINEVMHYILGIPAITVDSFFDDIDDLSEWLVERVENGELTNRQVDIVNEYVTSYVARTLAPSLELITKYYPNMSIEQREMLRQCCLFSVKRGKVGYVPMLAGELGLNNGYNVIKFDNSEFFNTYYSDVSECKPTDYIVTADYKLYKYVGVVGEDAVVLRHVEMA